MHIADLQWSNSWRARELFAEGPGWNTMSCWLFKKTLQKMTNRTHNLNQPKKKSNYEKRKKKDNTVQNESSTADNSAKSKGSHRCVRKKKGLKP